MGGFLPTPAKYIKYKELCKVTEVLQLKVMTKPQLLCITPTACIQFQRVLLLALTLPGLSYHSPAGGLRR